MPLAEIANLLGAAIIIALAVYAIGRGIDVRMALILAAVAIGTLAGNPVPILRMFLATFSNEKFVVPICTAMGFAYVLKHTECDQHLVRLLTRPLRSARLFLIPGTVLVGFLVNIPVISQTSTAVCIGAVVVPLLRAAGLSNITIGATILLGSSIGGELLNPGAPELNTVGERLGISSKDVIPKVVPLIFPHLVLATIIYWWFSARWERRSVVQNEATTFVAGPASPLRALVPAVPLVLLFLTGPPLNAISVPEEWIAPSVAGKKSSYYETRLIGAAMLVGVVIAAIAVPSKARGVAKAFFDGAGYGFAEVVSIIVAAQCFGAAVDQIGLAELIGRLIKGTPELLVPLAGALPLGFGALSGSGMAATQSLYGFFAEPANVLGADPKEIGAVVSVGAAAGRTMSPVAAVALMSARLTGTSSFELARRVAPPLLISLTVIVAWRALVM